MIELSYTKKIIEEKKHRIMLVDDEDLEYMNMLKKDIELLGYTVILNTSTSWITHNVFLELEVL